MPSRNRPPVGGVHVGVGPRIRNRNCFFSDLTAYLCGGSCLVHFPFQRKLQHVLFFSITLVYLLYRGFSLVSGFLCKRADDTTVLVAWATELAHAGLSLSTSPVGLHSVLRY